MGRPRLSAEEVKHGTMAGHTWHSRWKVPQCAPCLAAKAKHNRDMDKKRRDQERQDEPRRAAWQRACSRLAQRYPAEFREILLEEMKGVAVSAPPEDEQGEAT